MIHSLYKYTSDHEASFSQSRLDTLLNTFCESWNALEFTDGLTPEEIHDYVEREMHTDPGSGVCDTEYFLFTRLFNMISALDFFGPCDTAENAARTLARGKLFLHGGMLSLLRRLPAWTTYADYFENWSRMIASIVNSDSVTYFTSAEGPTPELRKEWQDALRIAFGRLF